jgi:hypothetical protein
MRQQLGAHVVELQASQSTNAVVSPALQLRALVDLARALAGACGSQREMPSGPPPSTIGTAARERDPSCLLVFACVSPI